MVAKIKEYRYGTKVRQRAVLLCGLSVVAFVGLVFVLVQLWSAYGWSSRLIALFLAVVLLFTVRAQLGRVFYRLQIGLDSISVLAPLANRTVQFDRIVEVRRTKLPAGIKQRWAGTLLVRNATGSATPVFLFDNQLEGAEEALQQLVGQTPNAQHYI
jgi:hypothetical protein